MSKKINIGKILVGFNGKPLLNQENKHVTAKDILIQYVGAHMSQDGRGRIMTRMLGEKLFKADPNKEWEIEDAEFNLLKQTLEKPMHPDIILVQIDEMMDEVKEKKDK